jgi:endoglucanase
LPDLDWEQEKQIAKIMRTKKVCMVDGFFKKLPCFILLSLSCLACKAPAVLSQNGMSLRVNGNKLEYGANGHFVPVVLRGVNVGDLYHFKKFNISAPNFAYISGTMNANAIRIAIHPNLWLKEKDANFAYLKENVKKALDANLFVLIDFHTIGFPDGYVEPNSDPVLGDAYNSSFKVAREFWNLMSKEFTDGRILFELWNEPISQPDYAESKWPQLKAYWEKLIKIIRANGSDNVIVAGGDYWTHDLRGIKNNLLSDANTAYAWHIYANNANNNAADWEKSLDGLNEARPVLVTEWGYTLEDKDDVTYAPPSQFADKFVANFLTRKGLNSFAWGYDPFYTPSMLNRSSSTPYTDFSEYGKYVVNYLQSCNQVWPLRY